MNERSRRARLDDIRRVAFTMREEPIVAPDLTSSILDRVDAERPFLAPSVRRRLPWIRMGLGACVAMTALGIALTYRWAPKTMQMVSLQPAPISDVVQCVECAASHRFIPEAPKMLSIRESDATHFLAAMATAANLSEGEGRRPSPQATLAATQPVSARMTLPSQVVSLSTPAAPRAPIARSDAQLAPGLAMSIFPAESIMSSASVRTAVFSSDVPHVRVVPTFLEHDLDGALLPR